MTIDCVDFCKALADDTRQQILQMLIEKEMYVSDIAEAFEISQPSISHHLNVLKQFGLVVSRRDGQRVYYRANQNNVVECCGRLIAKFGAEEACEL